MGFQRPDPLLVAVNLCLQSIGRQPVPAIDVMDLDVAQAMQCIEAKMVDTLDNGGEGWWFNTETNWGLTADAFTGEVQVPNNVLAITECTINGKSYSERLTVRAGRLWDKVQHTFDLSTLLKGADVVVTFVLFIEFNDMPVSAQRYVQAAARAMFAWDVEGDPNKLASNERAAQAAHTLLLGQHTKQMQENVMASPLMQEFLCGEGGGTPADLWRGKI